MELPLAPGVWMQLITHSRSGRPTVTVTTDAQGQATCNWTLGAPLGMQVVEAVLQAGPNQIVPPVSVRFTAEKQSEAGTDPGFHVTGLTLLSTGGPLKNDMDL